MQNEIVEKQHEFMLLSVKNYAKIKWLIEIIEADTNTRSVSIGKIANFC
jgi:hypothetical protein